MAKKLIKFMLYQDGENLHRLGNDSESIRELPYGKSEKIVQIVMYKLNSLYCEDTITRSFLNLVRKYRKGVSLSLDDPDVEKISDKTEQYLSIPSWLFKHRFKMEDCLLRTSY
ncbi:hypothetical protein DMB44_03740 [Thermoplasma sp. Kam2015]|nr:hypothetical protein DMB44_03740 [Thermoplasma sp. Kam2015]